MPRMASTLVKKFGDKKYTFAHSLDTRREAVAKANQLRKQGKFVRMWHTTFKGKPAYWELYIR